MKLCIITNSNSDEKGISINSAKTIYEILEYYKCIKIKDIIYVEAFDDYVKIHLNTRLAITTKLTMSTILNRIKNYGFIRVHRSFIVSKDMIDSLNKNYMKLKWTSR